MKYGFMSSELVSWLYEHDKMMRGKCKKVVFSDIGTLLYPTSVENSVRCIAQ